MTTTITRNAKALLMIGFTLVVAAGLTLMAAPAGAAQPASISADPNDAGVTATHSATTTVGTSAGNSFNGLDLNYSVGSTASDVSNVGQGDILTFTVNGADISSDVSDVSASNNGEDLNITLTGSTTLAVDDTIFIEFADAQNASSDDEVDIVINPQSDADSATVTLAIAEDTSDDSEASAGGGAMLEAQSSDNDDDEDMDEEEDFEMVTINVMKHICAEGIEDIEDFNNVDVNNNGTTEFTDKVLSCPTVVMEGDDYYEDAIAFSDKRDFNFRVTGQDNEDQDIDEAELVNQQVCEMEAPEDEDDREENTVYLGADLNDDGEMNACADTSFYSYTDVAGGDDISVTEFLSPTGERGGALEFTPPPLNDGFDEEQTLGDDDDRFEGGVVELDSTEDNDGTITLHLYNFQSQDDEITDEELQELLNIAREQVMNLADVLGAQDSAPGFPNTGDGSLSLSAQILN